MKILKKLKEMMPVSKKLLYQTNKAYSDALDSILVSMTQQEQMTNSIIKQLAAAKKPKTPKNDSNINSGGIYQ